MELLVVWLLFAVFSAMLASHKNRSAAGWFFAGLLLGPFGLLVAFFPSLTITSSVRACPHCAEPILREAVVCKHCGRDVPAAPPVQTYDGWG